ncbi:MAG: hypothetical protein RLN82_06800, partial [Pseudomonadales bacterium]
DMMEEKRDLVRQFSAGRCTSTKSLLFSEADQMIKALLDQTGEQPSSDGGYERMVKKMLYYGYEMGFDKPRHADQHGMKASKINFQNVDAWCRSNKSKFGKPLNDMDFDEMRITLGQFERMYKNQIESLAK